MSIHIVAKPGDIAGRVLFPGDPLRAEYIAEEFLTDVVCYNTSRNMLGFTGFTPEGRQVSVQGSGMGMPSLAIYTTELIRDFGVKEIIRVGTCGALQEDIRLREIILAQGSCSESNLNRRRFKGMDFAPLASWDLLYRAFEIAQELDIPVRVGGILAADKFYNEEDPDEWWMWSKYGVLAVEMESAELYTIAAQFGIRALSILTVSDSLPHKTKISPEDRQSTLADMVKLALAL